MKQELKKNGKRVVAGFLAFAMVAVLALGDAGVAFAAESGRLFQQITGKHEDKGYEEATASDARVRERRSDVMMNVTAAEGSEFYAGGTLALEVRIKNDTDGVVDGGSLSFWANGVAEDSIQMELPEAAGDEEAAEITDGFVLTNDLEGEAAVDTEVSYATPSDAERWGEEEDVVSRTIEGIRLNPGQVYTALLCFDIDEKQENKRVQSVKLRFQGQGEEKKVRVEDSFDYTVNGMNIDEVAFAGENRTKPGSLVSMGIHAGLFDGEADSEESLDELLTASPSDAARTATPSNAELTATPSDAQAAGTEDSTVEVQAAGASYEIDIHNLELKDFEVEEALTRGDEEKVLLCSFEVPKKTAPGVYFGKVTQKFTKGGFASRSTQGFTLVVEPDGEISLEGSLGDELVTVSGPAEAFPEADQLVVKVSEPDEEQQALAEAAMQKLLDEGEDISGYRAVDIKLYADGVEAEPEGNVQVTFSNMFQDSASTLALAAEEADDAEALDDDTAEASENEPEEEIRIFHLDEASGTANEVASETRGNGDVVMETNHFSTWIGVRSVKERSGEEGAKGFVHALKVTKCIDGTKPWDNSDTDGNDNNDENKRVRTFDTIKYDLALSTTSFDENYEEAKFGIEMILPMDITEAEFDFDQMLMLKQADYTLTYYDKDWKELASEENGKPKNYKPNEKAKGNNNTEGSYRTDVAYQVVTSSFTMKGDKDNIVMPGTRTVDVGVRVLAANNGTSVQPTVRIWVDGNEDNVDSYGKKCKDNVVTPEAVIVSAKARYNVAMDFTNELNYKGYFNFDTGKGGINRDELGEGDIKRGRMLGYNISVQLYNETDNPGKLAEKGLKGIELPIGPITMQVDLAESVGNLELSEEYQPLLWDYTENAKHYTWDDVSYQGKNHRNLMWDKSDISYYGRKAPGNNRTGAQVFKSDQKRCYDGGNWKIDPVVSGENPENKPWTSKYEITIDGYDFDLDNFVFPESEYQISIKNDDYCTYVGVFSAGYLQILMQHPEKVDDIKTIYLEYEVSNLKLKSLSGDTIEEDVDKTDNKNRTEVSLYPEGNITKFNSFTKLDSYQFDVQFLGTNYWSTEYDASCFAGDKIALWGGFAQNTAMSDYHVKAYNILQKFDAQVFKPYVESTWQDYDGKYVVSATSEGKPGDTKLLYAADPMYPEGWDTTDSKHMLRMNRVQEEDLVYFEDLDELKEARYTCTAVLLEGRNCDLYPRQKIIFKIPVEVEVNEEKLKNRDTYCTVSSVRAWTSDEDAAKMSQFTWGDQDKQISDAERNQEPRDEDPDDRRNIYAKLYSAKGYVKPHWNHTSNYKKDRGWAYTKAEFDDGVLRNNTNYGGSQYGMSLMVVGYKSKLMLNADKSYYNMDANEREVRYTISSIGTTVNTLYGEISGPDQPQKTDLTIQVELGDKLKYRMGSFYCGDKQLCDTEEAAQKPENLISYTYKLDGVERTDEYAVYYSLVNGNVVFHILDVQVAAVLKDIRFIAEIGNPGAKDDVEKNEVLTTSAKISGSSDNRTYSQTNGNMAEASIGITRSDASGVYKQVDHFLTELNQPITYTVVYNNINNSSIKDLYLYDSLPITGDSRQSKFHNSYTLTKIEIELEQEHGEEAELYLGKQPNENAEQSFKNKLTDLEPIGETIGGKLKVDSGGLNKYADYKVVGVHVRELPSRKKVKLHITIQPVDNEAKDIYGNDAKTWVWNANEDTSLALKTNVVQTIVVSRALNGKIWHDFDWDGSHDLGEELVSGVQVGLLKLDEKTGNYVKYDQDVKGVKINPVTVGDDGKYEFKNLHAGRYQVVFFGDKLNSYIGETKFQVQNVKENVNSDALKSVYNEYSYMIDTNGMVGDKNGLVFVPAEQMNVNQPEITFSNLDLGLVKGAKLQLKKQVDAPEGMIGEPIAKPYKFLIRLVDEATKEEYTTVALGHGDLSGIMEINDFWSDSYHSNGVRKYIVKEIVPMEYTMTRMESKLDRRLSVIDNNNIVTVYPGDDNLITIHNKPEHSGYFHRTASVTNVKAHNSDKFVPENPYKEPHGKSGGTTSGTQMMQAVVKDRDEEKERRLEKGDDLYG